MDAEGRGARPAARPHAASTIRRDASGRSPGWSPGSSSVFGGHGVGGCRDAGHHLPRHRPGQERQLDLVIGRPLDRDWQCALGRPVRLANDANCFALSEATDGAGRARACLRRHPRHRSRRRPRGGRPPPEGAHHIAGEWGHNPLPAPADDERPGPRCYCGRSGCIETFLSGPGWRRTTARRTGRQLDADALARAARNGDAAASAAVARYVDSLARALATVINMLDPDVIVLGGGLSNLEALYEDVPRAWVPHVFSDEVHTLLRPAQHGDSSGVRGAAWLW